MNINSPSSVSSDTRAARVRSGSTSLLLLAFTVTVVILAPQLTKAALQDNNAALRDHYNSSLACYASVITTSAESEVLLTKPRDISVRKGDTCQFDVMANTGCTTNLWMSVGQCSITKEKPSGIKCPPDNNIDKSTSCRDGVYTVTFRITFDDEYFQKIGDAINEIIEIAYFINHERNVSNISAHIMIMYTEPEPQTTNSSPGTVYTSTPATDYTAESTTDSVDSSSLSSMYTVSKTASPPLTSAGTTDSADTSSLNSMYVVSRTASPPLTSAGTTDSTDTSSLNSMYVVSRTASPLVISTGIIIMLLLIII